VGALHNDFRPCGKTPGGGEGSSKGDLKRKEEGKIGSSLSPHLLMFRKGTLKRGGEARNSGGTKN